MTRSTLLASVATLAVLTNPTFAQEVFDLEELVFSTNLSPVSANRTGTSVEVLDEDRLEDSQTLAQSLTRTPGVSYSANGGFGKTTTLRIRGLDTKYIGVWIDGIDVTDPSSTQTSYDFGGLTTGTLSRVEVLKGSQSALYGSEAIGGVVDISSFTPKKQGFSGATSIEAGSFGTLSGALNLAQKSGRGEIVLSYSSVKSDGISSRSSDTEEDGFAQKMLTFSTRYDLTDTLSIGASALWRDAENDYDASTTDSSGTLFTEQKAARVFAELTTGAIKHTFAVSQFASERRDPTGWVTMFDGDRTEYSYLATADLGQIATVNVGLNRTEESIATSSTTGAYDTNSAFAELQYRPSASVDLSATARYDDHSTFGGHWSGRLAAAWQATEATTLRASVGTGFRAPSLFELYSFYGDRSLMPEQSRSAELGVDHDFGSGRLEATVFYTEIDDLIDFDGTATACGSGFGCYNQVPGTTISKGVELGAEYDLTDTITLYGNYTYTQARNNGAALPRVPKHDLVLGVAAEITDRLDGSVEVQHAAGAMASAFAPAGHKVGDYTLLNVAISYDVTDSTQAYLRADNLLDEDYETAGGYNMPGRNIAFGLRADF